MDALLCAYSAYDCYVPMLIAMCLLGLRFRDGSRNQKRRVLPRPFHTPNDLFKGRGTHSWVKFGRFDVTAQLI